MSTRPTNPGQRGNRGGQTSRKKVYTIEAAKGAFIEQIKEGKNINAALDKVDRKRKTYEEWRRRDKDFAAKVDQARQLQQKDRGVIRGERMGFAEWRKKYLGVETYWHQLQWVDLLEGREPRDLHDAQVFELRKLNRLLINCPPFHGKSVTLSIDYVVYRLCMDPGFRVIIISAGAELAKDFLFGVKQRLTSPDFLEMQKAYAPDGGWEATSESWTESRIVFGAAVRAQSSKAFHEKDANVIALGMRSKVYGRRADLILVDDGVDTTNVAEHAKQLKWLRSMVESRLEAGGKLLVIGTRVASMDLYSELRNPENYANGSVPWTYLASPAILYEGETPDQHVTLWPRAQHPWVHPDDLELDGCMCGNNPACTEGFEWGGERVYAKWDGVHLEAGPRASNSATDWALVYQQSGISEDATFPEHAVQKSISGARLCGILHADRVGYPIGGMHDKYVIAGLDPSVKGFAGIVAGAVSRETQKRYVMNAWNLKAPTAHELKEKMKEITEHYGVHEWRVEKTGLLQFFTQDRELRQWMASRGTRFVEHNTGSNKWDATFGVSSMAPLFGEYDKAWNDPNGGWREITPPLIELPRPNSSGMKALIHQLITWTSDLDPNKVPCDLVMALWFFNTGAREHLGIGKSGNVIAFGRNNKFISPRQKNRPTVSLADYRRGTL